MPHHSIRIENQYIAQLTVHNSELQRIDIKLDLNSYTYKLGHLDAPLYKLIQPLSPDDAWEISVLPQGNYLPSEVVSPVTDLLQGWLANDSLSLTASLISSLPMGEYIIVRSPLRPRRQEFIVLGNERVSAPKTSATLFEDNNVYSYVWCKAQVQQGQTQPPLIGVPILNYGGDSSITRTLGVHFFSFFSERSDAAKVQEPEARRYTTLIIPKTSDLVIDNVWSSDGPEKWRREGAKKFANQCCGGTAYFDS